MQCMRCHKKIEDTVHSNKAAKVGGYRLHTGETKVVKNNDPDSHLPPEYLQLSDPMDVYVCAQCLSEAEVRDVWLQDFCS